MNLLVVHMLIGKRCTLSSLKLIYTWWSFDNLQSGFKGQLKKKKEEVKTWLQNESYEFGMLLLDVLIRFVFKRKGKGKKLQGPFVVLLS